MQRGAPTIFFIPSPHLQSSGGHSGARSRQVKYSCLKAWQNKARLRDSKGIKMKILHQCTHLHKPWVESSHVQLADSKTASTYLPLHHHPLTQAVYGTTVTIVKTAVTPGPISEQEAEEGTAARLPVGTATSSVSITLEMSFSNKRLRRETARRLKWTPFRTRFPANTTIHPYKGDTEVVIIVIV